MRTKEGATYNFGLTLVNVEFMIKFGRTTLNWHALDNLASGPFTAEQYE